MRSPAAGVVLAVVAFAAVFFAPELTGRGMVVTANMDRWRPWMETATAAEREAPSHNPDSATSYYPRRWMLHDAWRRGELPLWNPWSFCGAPFLADPQAGVLYPPNWVLLPLDPGWQLGVFLFLHVAWGGVGAALLLRRRGVPPAVAAAFGCAFVLNGFFAKHFGQPPFLAAASWIPWVVLATIDVVERPRSPAVARLALVGAGVFLAGQPQIAMHAAYAAAVVAVVAAAQGRARAGTAAPGAGAAAAAGAAPVRIGLALAAGGVLAVLLVAAQLLPTLELARRSARADLPWPAVLSGAFHPVDAIRFAVEEFFGSPLTGDEWAFLFPRGDGFYLRTQINSVFAGTPILLLALVGMISRRTRGAAAPFTVLFVLSAAIAFGSPLARAAYTFLPGFGFARLDRIGAVVVLAQLVPAGLAAASLVERAGRGRRTAGFAIIAGAALAVALVTAAGRGLPEALGARVAPDTPLDPSAFAHTSVRTITAAAFAALTGVALILPASRVVPVVPPALAAIQLFAFAAPYRADRRPMDVFAPTPGIERLREVLETDARTGGGRFLRFGRDQPVRPYPISSVLPPSTNVPYRLRDVQGYNALSDRALGEALERATGEPLFSWGIWTGRRIVEPVLPASLEHPLLDALAVRAVVGAVLPAASGWTSLPCEGFALARNDEARPRVSLAFAGHGVTSEEMTARLAAGRIDPSREVLWVGEGSLEAPASPGAEPTARPEAAARTRDQEAGGGPAGRGSPARDGRGEIGGGVAVEVLADTPNRLIVRCRADREGILVVADSADPGWQATVNGRPSPVLGVWGLIRGVRVPPGPSLVEMRYRPRSLVTGCVLSLLALMVVGAAAIVPGRVASPGEPGTEAPTSGSGAPAARPPSRGGTL